MSGAHSRQTLTGERRLPDTRRDYRLAPAAANPPPGGQGHGAQAARLRVCIMATIGESVQVLYAGRLEYFLANGFDVSVVCAPSAYDDAIRARGVRLWTVAFARSIDPWTDWRVLSQLYRFLRRERFDLVEAGTPKAALLGVTAARLARVPCVIHLLHGAPYEGQGGLVGPLLRASTWVPCRLATHTVAVSPSLAERVTGDRIAPRGAVRVLGAGSANGVDLTRFAPDAHLAARTRGELGIARHAVVIGFVGRLVGDKGIDELAQAFVELSRDLPQVVLLIVGPVEDRDAPAASTCAALASHPAIRHVGLQMDVLPYLVAMDVVALPTHREGLGNVLLEAAACGIATVTTTATGARDAIVPEVTGVQVPVGDAAALGSALRRLVCDPDLRQRMGQAGRRWVGERFASRAVWQRQMDTYRSWAQQCRERSRGAD